MILFANDPLIYRHVMALAFAEESEEKADVLPDTLPLDRAIEDLSPTTVVISLTDAAARRLSLLVPVVNLSHDLPEHAETYLDGTLISRAELGGFPDLVQVIESLTKARFPS